MRDATVECQVSWYSALNAIEMIVGKANDDDKARFSEYEAERLERVAELVREIIGKPLHTRYVACH